MIGPLICGAIKQYHNRVISLMLPSMSWMPSSKPTGGLGLNEYQADSMGFEVNRDVCSSIYLIEHIGGWVF
jgi:hypothetical protein